MLREAFIAVDASIPGYNMSRENMVCKRDSKPLFFMKEVEKVGDGTSKITYSYKCVLCNYKVEVEQILVSRNSDGLVIRRVAKFPNQL
ncbi:MAG: hypothetical protein QXP72_01690 [Desulfurococcaceae archaeon]